MVNSVDPDQTAPIGFFSNVRQLFPADDFSRRHFQMHFVLGALRVNIKVEYDKLVSLTAKCLWKAFGPLYVTLQQISHV